MQLKFYNKDNQISLRADINTTLTVVFQQVLVNGQPFLFRMLCIDPTKIKPGCQEDCVLKRRDMNNAQNPITHLAAYTNTEEYAVFLFSHSSGEFIDHVMNVKYTAFSMDIRRRSLSCGAFPMPLTHTNPVVSIKSSPQPTAEICFTVPNMLGNGHVVQRIRLSPKPEVSTKLVSREKLNGNCVIDCMVVDN